MNNYEKNNHRFYVTDYPRLDIFFLSISKQNKMRKLLIIITCCILFSCGEIEKKATRNHKNLHKISIGMPEKEVLKIMGTPKKREGVVLREDKQYQLIYDSSFGMSDNIIIIFSVSDSLVVGINDGT